MSFLGGLLVGSVAVAGLIWEIFCLIASIKVVQKMGEKWWAAIIPFYHDYVLYKHVWIGWIGIVAAILQMFGSSAPRDMEAGITFWVGGIIYIVYLVFNVLFCRKLAAAFGKGEWFSLGLFFLEPIFTLILGFGDAQYLGNPSEGEVK